MELDRRVEILLDLLPDVVRSQFAANPKQTLREELGLVVQPVDHLAANRDDGGACDGVSYLQDGVILYAPTHYSRRENFTLAHELGHWLVEQGDLYDWLGEQDDPARMLETVCDHIAQRLLLPDGLIKTAVGPGPIRARHVLDLYGSSSASAPVCAIALAKRLPGFGAVLIADCRSSAVTHASVRADFDRGWPTVFPWPKQAVPPGHPILNLAAGQTMTKRVHWRNQWGKDAEFYADAVNRDGKTVIAVFSENDLWGSEALHIDRPREYDERPVTDIFCCGEARVVRGYPCRDCKQPFCPECGRCRCDRAAQRERTCVRCFVSFQRHLLVGGECEDCRN